MSRYPKNPIALCEAPKTAVIVSLYLGLPEDSRKLLWLAVYNKSSFSLEKLKVLAGRTVHVFPDLSKDGSTFREWKEKVETYEKQIPGVRFIMDDFLEKNSDIVAKLKGYDLADYFIQLDWHQFRKDYINKDANPIGEQKVIFLMSGKGKVIFSPRICYQRGLLRVTCIFLFESVHDCCAFT